MLERIQILALAASASGASIMAAVGPATADYAWIASVAAGCFAALIVRAITLTSPSKKKKKAWVFEFLVSVLSVFVTGVVVYDRSMTIAAATMIGITIGGMGQGLISFVRSIGMTALTNVAKAIVNSHSNQPPEK